MSDGFVFVARGSTLVALRKYNTVEKMGVSDESPAANYRFVYMKQQA